MCVYLCFINLVKHNELEGRSQVGRWVRIYIVEMSLFKDVHFHVTLALMISNYLLLHLFNFFSTFLDNLQLSFLFA